MEHTFLFTWKLGSCCSKQLRQQSLTKSQRQRTNLPFYLKTWSSIQHVVPNNQDILYKVWQSHKDKGERSMPPPSIHSTQGMKKCHITNLQNQGLISADRGTKATLIRTIPSSLFKSYTKDLLFPIFELVFQHWMKLLSRSPSADTMLWSWPEGCAYSRNTWEQKRIVAYQHGFWLRGVQP